MPKSVDLTGKLGLAGKPTIKVGDVTLTVNDSARSMLQIVKIMDGDPGTAELFEACDLLFDARSRKAIEKMDLSLDDFMTLVETAMGLVLGEDGDEGNAETPATT